MDQAEVARFKRHDYLMLTAAAKARLAASVELGDARAAAMAAAFFAAEGPVFGIVRRDSAAKAGEIPVGLVPDTLLEGNRLRIASFVRAPEIAARIEPCELLRRAIVPRNRCMQAAAALAQLPLPKGARLGLLGSAGLEILTGRPYTNETSDLDCLIDGASAGEIAAVYEAPLEIGARYRLDIDLEAALPNGYGIKVKELLMQTQALLGKSLADVRLLPRGEVLQILK